MPPAQDDNNLFFSENNPSPEKSKLWRLGDDKPICSVEKMIGAILIDNQKLWLGGVFSGIRLFSLEEGKFINVNITKSKKPELSIDYNNLNLIVRSLYRDENNLWVHSNKNGSFKFNIIENKNSIELELIAYIRNTLVSTPDGREHLIPNWGMTLINSEPWIATDKNIKFWKNNTAYTVDGNFFHDTDFTSQSMTHYIDETYNMVILGHSYGFSIVNINIYKFSFKS